jgi:hypothetical protein
MTAPNLKLVHRSILLAKVEGAYNTDSVPVVGTDAMLVSGLKWSHDNLRMIKRDGLVRPSLGKKKSLYGGSLFSLSFDKEIVPSGVAGTPPEMGPLLKGSGFGETVVAVTSVTYKPVSYGHSSLSMYFYEDGDVFKVTGCRGTVEFDFKAGAVGMAKFKFTGHLASFSAAAFPVPAYTPNVPIPLIGGGFAVDGFAAVIESLKVSMGIKLAMPASFNSADGYDQIQILGRDVGGSFDPQANLIADYDWRTKFVGGNALALDTGAIGAVAGAIYRLQMPAISYRNMEPGDRDGVETYAMTYGAHETAALDDEVSLAFT